MTRLTLDPLLVSISLLFSFSAAWLVVEISSRVSIAITPPRRALWMTLGALSMGIGLWVTQCMGQLAYHAPSRMYCDVPLLALSFCAAVLTAWLAVHLLTQQHVPWSVGGGVLIGLGIAAMHLTGDACLRNQQTRLLPIPFRVLSSVLGTVLCMLALHLLRMVRMGQNESRRWPLRKIVGTLLLGAAAPCMKFLDMLSTRVQNAAPAIVPVYPHAISIEAVAMVCLVMGICLAVALALLLGAAQQDAASAEEIIAENRQKQEELDEAQRRLVRAFRGAGVGVWQCDPQTYIFQTDEGLREMYGLSGHPEFISAAVLASHVHPEDVPKLQRSWFTTLAEGRQVFEEDSRITRATGEIRHVRTIGTVNRDPAGHPLQLIGMTWDVTEEHQQRRALQAQEERFLRTLEGIADAVIAVDEQQCVLYVNPAAAALMAVTKPEWHGKALREIFFTEDEITGAPRGNPIDRCMAQGGRLLTEDGVLVSRDGHRYNIRKRVTLLEGDGAVITFQDITAERAAAKALQHAATHDAMTGVANRQMFESQFAKVWDEQRQPGRAHCLCVIDLDRFKIVNDTLGHPAGDALLKQVVGLLESHVAPGDLLARMGGDEFLLLLHDTEADSARVWAQLLLASLAAMRFTWEGRHYNFTASIGIVQFGASSTVRETLISEADMAMLSSKRHGRNQVSVHQQGGIMLHELQALSQITSALEENRFELHAQPIVPVHNTDERSYFELLIRMRDGNDSLVSPALFIPTAERHGIMHRIDRWVIHHALSVYSCHPKLGQLRFAINLSGQSLSDTELWSFVSEEIRTSGVPPHTITFEVTETGIIENMDTATAFLQKIRAMGCRVALDDFGTGMSSLSYLKQFPLDFIKIDGSFVRQLRHSELDRSIVRATAKIAHTMYAVTIGECLEDFETIDLLEELGVGMVQGRAIGWPKLLQDVLREHAGEPTSA